MYKVIRKSDAATHQIADNKSVVNYVTKDLSPGVSLAVAEATSYDGQETTDYNRIYYVLEGELTLTFNDESVALPTGDSCFVAQGTTYTMRGAFKAVVVNQPAFGTVA